MTRSTLNSSMKRRGFLRGVGAMLSLPALEAFAPVAAAAQGARLAGTTAAGDPLRLAYLYVPNGVNLDLWRPQGEGKDYQLGESFKALEGQREDFQIFSGFGHANANGGKDGAGDHARANATFLTGVRAKKTAGSDINLGVSVDQMAARVMDGKTRFSSLELSCDGVRKSGSCDSGYSCAYQYNISWRSATQPMAPEANPRLVFERLFGVGDAKERAKNMQSRLATKRSILDFVNDQAQGMHQILGRNDQQKLDEYLTGVREIERRVEMAESFGPPPEPGVDAPNGTPQSYEEHIRLMMDMMVLAFQTDSTRVSSFLLAHDGSNRSFKELGVPEGHHHLSHHQRKEENLEKIARIDRFYLDSLSYFLKRMKETKEANGKSLLDNSMIVYGSGIADGDRHSHLNLPVIVAGKGGGVLTPGRHTDLKQDVPMSNLYLRMLHEFGAKAERFGDSTGVHGDV
ncbi:MAG: DUF1552 domain-containing protein [Verrucomicrobiales bacterium]